MPVATINGTAVNFGFHGTNTIAAPVAFSGRFILQSGDVAQGATNERTMDEVGNVVVSAWMDFHQKATLEWVVKGTGLGDSLTGSTIATLTPGTFVSISACTSMPDLVGSTWETVSEPKISGSNTSAKKVSLSLEKRAGITGLAAA